MFHIISFISVDPYRIRNPYEYGKWSHNHRVYKTIKTIFVSLAPYKLFDILSEIDILTTLSDSTPKNRHVDIVRHGGKVKENMENKSSPRKCELSTELFVLVVWKKEVSNTATIV